MDDTKIFVAKMIGGAFCLGVFLVSSATTPLLLVDPVLRGSLLAVGLGAFGLNIGAAVAGARAAGVRAAKRPRAK